jgi:hypothetical protein
MEKKGTGRLLPVLPWTLCYYRYPTLKFSEEGVNVGGGGVCNAHVVYTVRRCVNLTVQ